MQQTQAQFSEDSEADDPPRSRFRSVKARTAFRKAAIPENSPPIASSTLTASVCSISILHFSFLSLVHPCGLAELFTCEINFVTSRIV